MCRGKREGWNRLCEPTSVCVCVCVCVCVRVCICGHMCAMKGIGREPGLAACPWPSGTVGSQSPGGGMVLLGKKAALAEGVDRQQGCVFWGSLLGRRTPAGTWNSPGTENLCWKARGRASGQLAWGHRGAKLHVGCVGLATSLPPDCCPPWTLQSSWSRDLFLLLRVCRVCYRENLWTKQVARIPRPSGLLGTSLFSWLGENFRENRCSLPQRIINEDHLDSGWEEFHVLSRDPQKSLKKALSPSDLTFIFTKVSRCKGRTLTYSGSQNQQEVDAVVKSRSSFLKFHSSSGFSTTASAGPLGGSC